MKIDPNTANEFIGFYREFLLEVYETHENQNEKHKLSQKLWLGRKQFSTKRALLREFIKRNEDIKVSKEIISAIENIKIASWVYLKDTRHYSVLISIDGLSGYGVLGLNDKIRDMVGHSGVVIETGVMQLRGRFVCDGLIRPLVTIGGTHKKDYSEKYKTIKEKQLFKAKASV